MRAVGSGGVPYGVALCPRHSRARAGGTLWCSFLVCWHRIWSLGQPCGCKVDLVWSDHAATG